MRLRLRKPVLTEPLNVVAISQRCYQILLASIVGRANKHAQGQLRVRVRRRPYAARAGVWPRRFFSQCSTKETRHSAPLRDLALRGRPDYRRSRLSANCAGPISSPITYRAVRRLLPQECCGPTASRPADPDHTDPLQSGFDKLGASEPQRVPAQPGQPCSLEMLQPRLPAFLEDR